MEDRLTRLEATCSACPINVVDVRQHQREITELKVGLGRIDEKLDGILHWMHNGGNLAPTERRLRALETWRAFILGAGTLAGIMFTTAIAWLAR